MAKKERKKIANVDAVETVETKKVWWKKLSSSLTDLFSKINKKMWSWTIRLTTEVDDVKKISTWVAPVDVALWGGIPEWRIIEIYWPESSWKTSLCLQIAHNFQKMWHMVALVDAEQAFSPQHAANIWVKPDELIYMSPSCWEDALQVVEELALTWEVKLIIVDSVAALVPRDEIDWEMWDTQMWKMARLMWQACRKLTPILAKTWTTVIFINQIRQKIWVMFWSNETVTWGNSLKYYASQRIDVRKKEFLKEDKSNKDKVTWILMKVKVIKNKIAAPGAEVFANFRYKWWFDPNENIVEALLTLWIIKQTWPSYKIEIDWQEYKAVGKANFANLIKEWTLSYDTLYKLLEQASSSSTTFFSMTWEDEIPEDDVTEEDEVNVDDMDELSDE